MSRLLSIGQLSKQTGCKVPTIRYYEQVGLIPAPSRTQGNQRRYGPEHVARLGLIQRCREIGLEQRAVRDLIELANNPGRDCQAVTEIARKHLEDVNRRIARLRDLQSELEQMIEACDGGKIADCRIMATLSDHKH
jgi:Cu(I)-responsive transcriptional regulator